MIKLAEYLHFILKRFELFGRHVVFLNNFDRARELATARQALAHLSEGTFADELA